ncbi:MAG TPA: hypothetical protein VFK05_34410, partial [Polyangiaceae bacterium]|nr:hypothetical protein [Polyangiaceae bacterium]
MRQSWGWVGSLTLVALSSPACAGKVTPAEQGNTGGSKSSPPASASAGRSSLMDPGKPIIMGAAGSSNSSGTGTGGMAPAVSGVPPQAGAAPHAGGENAGAGGQGVIIV